MSRYDAHAEWYDDFLQRGGARHTARVTALLADLLGPGPGACLDIGCGTGAHAATLRGLGWSLLGADPSAGQLAIARHRLPVVRGDGARLPVRTGSVDAAVATLIHTDVDDWAALLVEAARVLRPGGRFAYVGVHPCFVSPYAVVGRDAVTLLPGYTDPSWVFDSPAFLAGRAGLRARVGVRHRTLADVLGPIPAAGLALTRIVEDGGGIVPDLLAFAVAKPTGDAGSVA